MTVLAHGTFLGHIRLEAHKPQQVPIDSTISFGASTRTYTIREKPQTQGTAGTGDSKTGEDEELKGLLGLPEEETELEVHIALVSHALKHALHKRERKWLHLHYQLLLLLFIDMFEVSYFHFVLILIKVIKM